MKNHNFKIGDKVKLKNPQNWSGDKQIGIIVGFDKYIRVDWEDCAGGKNYPHLPREIEYVVRIGEQLLLFGL